ncbi:phage tail tape measure protein [Clostridium omnivorum]|uniref:Phage tail tape measure protein n=1 Tax=Clostridium omnivorum TaxID=1604902 RepID=A0ABQ5NCC1_9CLOT|nr:phage tail tape measure protein [Clostridium sp. E14]GLC32923.1 hypothetical protein bsdE14_43330 [Clostridium sp. E14]
MQKTDEHAEKVGGTLTKGIGTAAKWGIGIATAAAGAATGLFAMASKASETAANIDDISQRTNLSAKTLQEFKYAAEMSGFSLDTIEGSAKKLTATLGKVKDGNKDTTVLFKQLGVSVVDANGKLKSTDEVFPQVLAKLADMDNQTERNALMMQLFGKSAMDMAPLLNGGSAGIKQLTDEANKLGLVMSDDAVSSGAQFDDMLTQAKSSLGALATKIGIEVLPIAQQILNWVMTNMPTIQNVTSTGFNVISTAVKFLMDNSNWLIPVLGGLLGAILALNVINSLNGLMALWKASTLAQTYAQGGLNAVLAANPIGIVVMAIGLLIAAGIALYRNWDTVKAAAISVFGTIKNFVGGVIDGIKNGFHGMVNGVISGLNKMIRALNGLNFTVPDWVPVIGGGSFGFDIPTIPSYAVGTRYLPKDMLVQAHEGEMIVPKSENPYANSGGAVLPSGSLIIQIENFINDRKQSVQAFAEELEFYRKQINSSEGSV